MHCSAASLHGPTAHPLLSMLAFLDSLQLLEMPDGLSSGKSWPGFGQADVKPDITVSLLLEKLQQKESVRQILEVAYDFQVPLPDGKLKSICFALYTQCQR
ncbi:hypothetical protein Y1Q_0006557 [Alligator mississippiensis]|uniref:Uncharacterized protein n=1 Tax=Alligator mississippiensis TaxID=8496 RepID=A0A151NT23_ALLMI|nr:hypothetical protein Y1Q_0006557 [Alligator mississippiensis]